MNVCMYVYRYIGMYACMHVKGGEEVEMKNKTNNIDAIM